MKRISLCQPGSKAFFLIFMAAVYSCQLLGQSLPLPVTKTFKTSPLTGNHAVGIFKQPVSSSSQPIIHAPGMAQPPRVPLYRQSFANSKQVLRLNREGACLQIQSRQAPAPLPALALRVTTQNVLQTLSLSITKGPVGTPDLYAVYSDKILSVAAPGFLANDIDLNGEAITATAITNNVDHGTLAAFGNGSFTYTPTAGFTGIDSFSYTMKDASGILSNPVTVTITVLPPANRKPIGSPDAYIALSGTALSIAAPGFLANDADPDGEVITATAITDNVDHGALAAFGNGSFTYTPTAGFTGVDSFSYIMRDASGHLSDPVIVTVTVVEGNRPPVGVNDTYSAVINTSLVIAAPGFLANDIDPDGDAITATAITDNVDHGALAAFGNGSFTYTPTAGFTGVDFFSYVMRDAGGHLSGPITVTINVSAPTSNGPIGTPDLYAVYSDKSLSVAAPGFLANDIDPNGETITATAITDNVDHGTLAAFGNGSFTYTPTAGYTGTDAFSYTMKDASGNLSGPVTVTITVLPPANRKPIGSPDAYIALSGTALSIAAPGFLANDADQDGEVITATAITDNVDHGTLAAFGNGSFTYTPAAGFTGVDSFSYIMRDASGHLSDPVIVTITVVEGNRAPVGVNDAYTAVINTPLAIAAPGFLANDIDPDGDAITATAITNNVDHGTLAAFGNGSFNYTPNTGFTGADSFSYTMRDAGGHFTDPVLVTIEVVSPNRPPVANAGNDTTVDCDGKGGATVTLDGSKSTDPDGDPITYTWRENGQVIAGPTKKAQVSVFLLLGVHTIELTADDSIAGSSTDKVTIKVADITPPTITAAFVPKPDDREVFTIQYAAEDACDNNLSTTAVITLPALSQPSIKYQVNNNPKLKIDPVANSILVQAPDPYSFWNSIMAAGGVPVINGQYLTVVYNSSEYAFTFDKTGALKSVEGPLVILRCTATDGSGNVSVAEAIAPVTGKQNNRITTDANGRADEAVNGIVHLQNYPNPFTVSTTISFTLPENGPVKLIIYDNMGRAVQTLINGNQASGQHTLLWTPQHLAGGIYYYKIYRGNDVITRKMIYLGGKR